MIQKAVKEVVVVLPYVNGKVLMQLRDNFPTIDFPDQWGFFGGAVEEGESAEEAAFRELQEETGYVASSLIKLGTISMPKLISHAYCCRLTVPLSALCQTEGQDFGLFSPEEVRLGELLSPKLKRPFLVIPHPLVMSTVEKCCAILG